MAMFHCELCYFLTKSITNYNKHISTEEHMRNEDKHEIKQLYNLIMEKQDELVMNRTRRLFILKNKPFELESENQNITFIDNLKNRMNELAKKHNLNYFTI